MEELKRFSDPFDGYGLRAWHHHRKSRLLKRLSLLEPRQGPPGRKGYYLLRAYFGRAVERLRESELEWAYQRLMTLDWLSRFELLGFFTEPEIRWYALLRSPPQESILGYFWHGLLKEHDLQNVEKWYLTRLQDYPAKLPWLLSGPLLRRRVQAG